MDDRSGKVVMIDMGKIEDWPISHLKMACKKNKVKGYTKMSKDELVIAVRNIIDSYSKSKGN